MHKTLKTLATLAIVACSTVAAVAQQSTDPVVIEVGGNHVRQGEFMREFKTNVGYQLAKNPEATTAQKREALNNYADLYALFRAKILDAHERGFDTSQRMLRELARYRADLAAPYLIDSAELRRLLAEAYERNNISLRAAHILVPLPVDATPEDTAARYAKAMELYDRITKGGEDFTTVAQEYAESRNPGRQTNPNEGELGYFSVFDMVYPFENAAYGLKVGEVSKPVRTRYGYHIIKLLDRVEGLFGKVTMAHIWLSSPDSATRAADINMLYNQLEEGASFSQVARQSDDRSTSSMGGVLLDASLSQLPPEYIHKLVGMKVGEYTKPFFTKYGWHIITLLERDTLPNADNLEAYYKQRMARDQRGSASKRSFAATCRKKYNIEDCTVTPMPQPKGKKKAPARMKATLDELVRLVPDSVRWGKWKLDESLFTDTTALVVTPSRRYTSVDVARHIASHQEAHSRESIATMVRMHFDEFLDSVSIDYADSQLENEYPEFAEVVDEYRQGLIIFNYNDAMIWRKAQDDSAGFAEFYARESVKKNLANPDDSVFFYNIRARVTIIDVADANALDANKAQKLVAKAQQKNMAGNEMKQLLLKKINHKKFADEDLVTVDVELVERGRQKLLADDQWQVGVYQQPRDKGYRLLVVDEILPRSLKGHMEARGYYLNAWQNEVERRLNAELRSKYNVKVNHNALNKIAL